MHRTGDRVGEMSEGGSWSEGEFTDDTDLTLALARAYTEVPGQFHPEAAANAMLAWYNSNPKDVGTLTRCALEALRNGRCNWRESGAIALQRMPGTASNGSLMRAAPSGVVRDWKLEGGILAEETRALSAITHAHPDCVMACQILTDAVSMLIRGEDPDWVWDASRGYPALNGNETLAFAMNTENINFHGRFMGWVALCLRVAFDSAQFSNSIEEGIKRAIFYGGDTDTNAAVAGALLGARFGASAIPERWLAVLKRRDEVEECATGLISAVRS
jgi:ADP-ribosyl-[dinitrogen reductase] hydrolase